MVFASSVLVMTIKCMNTFVKLKETRQWSWVYSVNLDLGMLYWNHNVIASFLCTHPQGSSPWLTRQLAIPPALAADSRFHSPGQCGKRHGTELDSRQPGCVHGELQQWGGWGESPRPLILPLAGKSFSSFWLLDGVAQCRIWIQRSARSAVFGTEACQAGCASESPAAIHYRVHVLPSYAVPNLQA